MSSDEHSCQRGKDGTWRKRDHIAPDRPFTDPEPTLAIPLGDPTPTQEIPRTSAEYERMLKRIDRAREDGIKAGRAQIIDHLIWLIPAVAIPVGIVCYLIGRYWQ